MMAKEEYRWLDRDDRPEKWVQRPRPGRWFRPGRLRVRDEHILHRRSSLGAPLDLGELEARAVSHDKVRGSVQERIVYKELEKRGIPFDFQSSVDGGRLQLGGMVADFILLDRPVVIRVQGSTWHATFRGEQRDQAQKAYIEGLGYTVLDIWDWEIEDDDLRSGWFSRYVDVMVVTAQRLESG